MNTKNQFKTIRAPLTAEELYNLPANELSKLKLTDEESRLLRALNDKKDIERAARSARLRVEEEPLLADLRDAGLNIESAWNLRKNNANYPKAIPILLKHLLLPYSDRIRSGIAHSLASPDARYSWDTLVAEYIKAPTGKGIIARGDTEEFNLGAKDGLACALAATVTEATIEELIEIMKDPSHGSSRVLMVSALRKSKNPKAKQALEVLAFDPDLQKEIAHWQNKKARPVKH
jgi:hypothetical protein